MYLVYDCETTGLITDPTNPPRIVQIAWVEYDREGNKIRAFNHIVRPDGFTIPQEATNIHKITNEKARERGIPLKKALADFSEAVGRSKYLVGHNFKYDQAIVAGEYKRLNESNPIDGVFKIDTMLLSIDYCKLPKSRGGFKYPKLEELHIKLFNKSFDGAHDALVDVEATGRCFFKLQELGVIGFKDDGTTELHKFGKEQGVKLEEKELYKPTICLGVHSYYSVLRGCGSVEDFIKKAKEYGHTAIGITDRSTLSGSLEFYQKCKELGIKPIIGAELYLNDNIGKMENQADEGSSYVQKILIKNKAGYINLNKLLFWGHTKGFNGIQSRISTDWLIENKEGLIVSTSGDDSYMASMLMKGRRGEAESYFKKLKDNFGDDLIAEIRLNERDEQKIYNEFILQMADKHDVTTIMDNDVHYVNPEDNELQDTLYTIGQKGVSLKRAKLFDRRHLYYPNRKDYINLNKKFGFFYPEKALEAFMDNALYVAEKCNFDFEIGVEKYPKYEPTQDVIDYFKSTDTEEIIYKLAFSKLKKKLKDKHKKGSIILTDELSKKYHDRLEYELGVIKEKNMLDYFLVNWELVRDYRKHGYEIGPARGSAAGCLLSYVLDITKVDPIKFNLYFERFLNPTRKCLTEDDVVLLKDGSYKFITDITLEDDVATETNQGELVRIYERELDLGESVYEIETENGIKIKLTGNHIVPVMRNGKREEVTVENIKDGDFFITFEG